MQVHIPKLYQVTGGLSDGVTKFNHHSRTINTFEYYLQNGIAKVVHVSWFSQLVH